MEPLIEARKLKKTYGDVLAISDLSLQVRPGEIYGLVGPDGAGKTTAMRLLCGALKADAGEFFIANYDGVRQTEEARRQIGYLPQRFSLYEELTVLENIRFFAEVRGIAQTEWLPRCMDILAFVGLDQFAERRAGNLSGGMKQKLGLAVALIHQPRVLLLDEPTSGVDPVTRQDFWQLVIRLVGSANQEGVAVLISTPYMDEAARCTRVGFLRRGHLLCEGSPAELCARLEGGVLELRGDPLTQLRRIAEDIQHVYGVQRFGDRLHLRVEAHRSPEVMEHLKLRIQEEGCTLSGLHVIPPQLEDVFIALLEEEETTSLRAAHK